MYPDLFFKLATPTIILNPLDPHSTKLDCNQEQDNDVFHLEERNIESSAHIPFDLQSLTWEEENSLSQTLNQISLIKPLRRGILAFDSS